MWQRERTRNKRRKSNCYKHLNQIVSWCRYREPPVKFDILIFVLDRKRNGSTDVRDYRLSRLPVVDPPVVDSFSQDSDGRGCVHAVTCRAYTLYLLKVKNTFLQPIIQPLKRSVSGKIKKCISRIPYLCGKGIRFQRRGF